MCAHVKNKCIWKYKLCNVVVYRICIRNVNISENIALISKTGNQKRATCFATLLQNELKTRGGGGAPHKKGVGMLVVSLRGLDFGFRSHLGCSGQNAITFSREGLV